MKGLLYFQNMENIINSKSYAIFRKLETTVQYIKPSERLIRYRIIVFKININLFSSTKVGLFYLEFQINSNNTLPRLIAS